MNKPKKSFSSDLLELSETSLRKELAAFQAPINPIKELELNLCVVEDRKKFGNDKYQANRFFSLKNKEGIGELQSNEDFDTFIDYIHTGYNDFAVAMLQYCGLKGDTVSLQSNIDETFAFQDDEFKVEFSIPIPSTYKQDARWITYLASNEKHRELAKLHANFVGFNVQVREHSVQSITFIYKFLIGQKVQTVKNLFESTTAPIPLRDSTSENEMRAFWLNAFNDIEQKVREVNQHSVQFEFEMIEIIEEDFTTFALEFKEQTVRIKL